MKKTFSQHSIIFLVTAVLFVIGLFCYMIYNVKSTIATTESLFSQVNTLEAKGGTLYSGKSLLRNSASALETVDASIARASDGVVFEKIEQFAKQSGVSLVLQSVTIEPVEGKTLQTMKLRLAFNGTWKNVVAFAYGIERFPFVLQVGGLSLVATNTSDKKVGEWNGLVDVALPVTE
jgi:hypothetical protein